jgi:hypothetical protein
VTVDGRRLDGRMAAWQRQIGYVPQHIYLSDDTVRRNVAFGVSDDEIDDARVWRSWPRLSWPSSSRAFRTASIRVWASEALAVGWSASAARHRAALYQRSGTARDG